MQANNVYAMVEATRESPIIIDATITFDLTPGIKKVNPRIATIV